MRRGFVASKSRFWRDLNKAGQCRIAHKRWKDRSENLARLYSGKRGSSGSTRPVSRRPPAWFKYEPEEIEALVLKLSKEGNPPSIIGQILRDRYGVPLVSQVAGKRLEQLLRSEEHTSEL